MARQDLPKRKKTANKSTGGKCLIVAGSKGMWGAAVLAASAAYRSGAGYVYLKTQSARFPIGKNPDFLSLNKSINFLSKKTIDSKLVFNAIAIGPGLSKKSFISDWIKKLAKIAKISVVVDATALNILANWKGPLPKIPPNWILTPHEGEMARLLGETVNYVRANRMQALATAQKKYGCIVLLKGHQTLVTDGHIQFTIPSGNSALAKAGTGDVLTGIITGLLAQGLDSISASSLAAYIHGLAADIWIEEGNDHLSLMASDLLNLLPKAIARLRTKK